MARIPPGRDGWKKIIAQSSGDAERKAGMTDPVWGPEEVIALPDQKDVEKAAWKQIHPHHGKRRP